MIDNEIIEEISSSYVEHSLYNNIIKDIKEDVNINYWADKFCTQEYYENVDLAQSMFEYSLDNCKDFRAYKELAFTVGNSNAYNDKEWARELLDKTIVNITSLRDLRVLADELSTKNLNFYDKELARSLYTEAIEKSNSAYEYYCIAESLSNLTMLDDETWAREIFLKAVEVSQNSDELTYIADAVADEDGLNDEAWAEELYEIAAEFDGTDDSKEE